MRVKRIIANVVSPTPAAATRFYKDILGLDIYVSLVSASRFFIFPLHEFMPALVARCDYGTHEGGRGPSGVTRNGFREGDSRRHVGAVPVPRRAGGAGA